MKPRLLSCIIPVFNGERYLSEALESIFAQTYRPLEIIVVDDGSTDGTAASLTAYRGQITYLWQHNAGQAAARNLGLRAAHGEFVAFLDADDLWRPEKSALQIARFQARPDLDLCVTHVQNFWSPELHQEEARVRDHPLMQALPGYVAPALMARWTLFESVGQFNIKLSHGSDMEWFMRAAEHGANMELLPDVLVYRRLHQSNRSGTLASQSRNEYAAIIKTSLDRRRSINQDAPPPYKFPAPHRDDKE